MIVETAMVKANCRKNCPVMPLMNAHGTNTALSTRPTAITGPETLAHPDPAIRNFWIDHGKVCRRIGAAIGEALGTPS